ncbi:hypothetical protein ZWY2020_047288 [Hordeum vulgare]|nr:hypothetical protein ZWY2020_047288 [Hordeum vulgare]
MISGHVGNRQPVEALCLFGRMMEEGFAPNRGTVVSVFVGLWPVRWRRAAGVDFPPREDNTVPLFTPFRSIGGLQNSDVTYVTSKSDMPYMIVETLVSRI